MINPVSVTDKIENTLRNDERTRDAMIEAIDNQGIVTLFGRVESNKVAQAAEEIAGRQEGVLMVTAWLFIEPQISGG